MRAVAAGFTRYLEEKVAKSAQRFWDDCQVLPKGDEPIAFAHDCREGICGTCSCTINGKPHGPGKGIATCQLYMRSFQDGDVIVVEPFRAKAFPLIKDLVVDRAAFLVGLDDPLGDRGQRFLEPQVRGHPFRPSASSISPAHSRRERPMGPGRALSP